MTRSPRLGQHGLLSSTAVTSSHCDPGHVFTPPSPKSQSALPRRPPLRTLKMFQPWRRNVWITFSPHPSIIHCLFKCTCEVAVLPFFNIISLSINTSCRSAESHNLYLFIQGGFTEHSDSSSSHSLTYLHSQIAWSCTVLCRLSLTTSRVGDCRCSREVPWRLFGGKNLTSGLWFCSFTALCGTQLQQGLKKTSNVKHFRFPLISKFIVYHYKNPNVTRIRVWILRKIHWNVLFTFLTWCPTLTEFLWS